MTGVMSDVPQHVAYLATRTKQLLIGGRWVDAADGETYETTNPSNGFVLARLAKGSAVDVDRAVVAAREALEGPWASVSPFDRQAILLKLADLVEENFAELATLDSLEFGGPISRTLLLRRRAVALLRYYAGQAVTIHGETIQNSLPGAMFSYTVKEPVGVVGAIIPWNGPLVVAIWKIAPALAAGCTVVLKPSEEASLAPLMFGELLVRAGVPDGVVNIVTGLGDVGAALTSHPGVDKVTFTGSTETGKRIVHASADTMKRLSLELGGKSPNIVFADADLDRAVPGAAMAVFANSGQICVAGSRMFVQDAVYDEFTQRVADFGAALKLGVSLDPTTELGPLVSNRQFEKVTSYIDSARSEGASALSSSGASRSPDGAGYFVPPVVFADVTDDMTIAREEVFGPVIAAIRFSDVDEVIARANQSEFGLASGVWTSDIGKAQRVAARLKTGTVWVNTYQSMDPAIPFGGFKMSGFGRESGRQHIEEFLEVKSIIINQ
jgi:aldehyde dehydrogenase (NAD+)